MNDTRKHAASFIFFGFWFIFFTVWRRKEGNNLVNVNLSRHQ